MHDPDRRRAHAGAQTLKIITLNANGIRAAARKGFYPWMLRQNADVVCIQETKAQEHQLTTDITAVPGYAGYFLDAQKKGYSGVAIYARREPDRLVRGLGWPDTDAEARYLQADFGPLSLASIYVPSGTSGPERQAVKYEFLKRFLPVLKEKMSEDRRYILCGDYNIAHKEIDVFSPRSCANVTGFLAPERAWFDRVVGEIGWVDAFRVVNKELKQFTWWSGWPKAWSNNLGWRIDYQLVSPALQQSVRSASIYKGERFSDHAPVTIEYDVDWSPP
ncbi:MAG: exodeoxyribonuclease III [Candidatus Meridianibacter frigidus]|nr:MAG: exodeoxyribonuclease III [Candidatus Eremiobacteraeota bacterium]